MDPKFLVAPALVLVAFVALYALVRPRGAPDHQPLSEDWPWLAAILALAAVTLLVGFLVR